ncbi:hypothetical protein [Actinomadura geliboluensis]|uniref:Uncharacterized protein n=1 Tax=Actinomadura geliboluensis TaxID=882440 RepID=A0A5S4GYM8_9ACTN|nr:hypothetical protein [Actinomadura geliboluensis]TMR37564.1 hypothetical protein ETD96_18125 [Actinomadura geliboluensis]
MTPMDDWNRLRPDTELAVQELHTQLSSSRSSQDLIDSYLYTKRLLAEAMQAFVRIDLVGSNQTFQDLRARLQKEVLDRYKDLLPERYLKVPYGTRVHEELFTLLLQRLGQPVQAAFLRMVTADSVHAERRIRELRELGIDIRTSKENGFDFYILGSLNVDVSLVPSIVGNQIKKNKTLGRAKRKEYLEIVGYSE